MNRTWSLLLVVWTVLLPSAFGGDNLCGVNSLYQVTLVYRMDIRWESVSELCKHGPDGTTMADIYRGARDLGMIPQGLKLSYSDLLAFLDNGECAIALVPRGHFLVVSRSAEGDVDVAGTDRIVVFDYPRPPTIMERESFQKIWGGEALLLAKDESPSENERRERTSGAHIEFERTLIDFGQIGQHETKNTVFKFRNTGDAPLLIEKTSSSCACAATLLSATTVVPGGTGELTVSFSSGTRYGRQTQEVTVHSTDADEPSGRLTVTVTGVVATDVLWSPRGLNFGTVTQGRKVSKLVTVLADSANGINLVRWECASPYVTCATRSVETPSIPDSIPASGLEVVLIPQELGELRERLVIYTNSARTPKIEIPFEAVVVGNVFVRPACLYFGIVEPGRPVVRSVTIGERFSSDLFTITNLTVDANTDLTTRLIADTQGRETEYVLTATLLRETPGKVEGCIILKTNRPNESEVKIPVFGLIEE